VQDDGLGDAIAIDGLDTSRWGSEAVYRDLRDGGVTAINATIAIWDDFHSTLGHITDWLGWFERYADLIRPVHAVADIRAAKAERRTGIILGWQNATPIENDLRRLALFHRLGVRIIQLTYNERNLLGNGCYERTDEGLSRFGQAAVREMNRLGILIDLSHVGDRTVLDTIELSDAPVAITHANARSQHDHPRNKTDDAIRRLVARGGVIGANACPMFFPNGFESTLDEYLDAIEYLVDMVGAEHVAVGTDFCQEQPRAWFEWIFSSQGTLPARDVGYTPHPYRHLRGLEGTRQFGAIATGLLARGYPPDAVRQVIGGNWLRLFTQVWRADAVPSDC
jgi:membrane dipeptidase